MSKPLIITIDGETKSFDEWANQIGMSKANIRIRCKRQGLTKEEVIKKGRVYTRRGPVTINGVTLNISQWCDKLGFKRRTIYKRLKEMSAEEALTTPTGRKD